MSCAKKPPPPPGLGGRLFDEEVPVFESREIGASHHQRARARWSRSSRKRSALSGSLTRQKRSDLGGRWRRRRRLETRSKIAARAGAGRSRRRRVAEVVMRGSEARAQSSKTASAFSKARSRATRTRTSRSARAKSFNARPAAVWAAANLTSTFLETTKSTQAEQRGQEPSKTRMGLSSSRKKPPDGGSDETNLSSSASTKHCSDSPNRSRFARSRASRTGRGTSQPSEAYRAKLVRSRIFRNASDRR
mmetsp:Transcript_1048/g.3075  ORF Transcript_1048/g.3075 Transcript_1048/m.3075 type:complete len:248 (-) Transcript_1048:347-1090(-)